MPRGKFDSTKFFTEILRPWVPEILEVPPYIIGYREVPRDSLSMSPITDLFTDTATMLIGFKQYYGMLSGHEHDPILAISELRRELAMGQVSNLH